MGFFLSGSLKTRPGLKPVRTLGQGARKASGHSLHIVLSGEEIPSGSSLPLPRGTPVSSASPFLCCPVPKQGPSPQLVRERPWGLLPRSKHRPQQLCLLSEDKGRGGPANRRPLIITLATALWPAMLFEHADLELGVEKKAFPSAQQSSPAAVLRYGFCFSHLFAPSI